MVRPSRDSLTGEAEVNGILSAARRRKLVAFGLEAVHMSHSQQVVVQPTKTRSPTREGSRHAIPTTSLINGSVCVKCCLPKSLGQEQRGREGSAEALKGASPTEIERILREYQFEHRVRGVSGGFLEHRIEGHRTAGAGNQHRDLLGGTSRAGRPRRRGGRLGLHSPLCDSRK
jgi:hypothetical protein